MRSFRSESGYALPSVLLLVTLLTLVAFSVLSLQYLRRQQALLEIARVRSEYAAQSGVARTLAALKSQTLVNEAMAGAAERYEFDDGSSSTVLVDSWGLYLLVKSEGAFRAVKSTRVALAGAKPLACFDNALLLGNTEHQLVVTGTASITGDVVVGQRGVSTGTLPGTPTPSRLPITGKVTRRSVSPMPYLNKPDLARLAADMADLLRGNTSGLRARVQINAVTIPARGVIGTGDIPDSADVAYIRGAAAIDARIARPIRPLYVVVDGDVSVRANARLEGLTWIVSSGTASILGGAFIENGIVFSQTQVRLGPGARVVAQLIAPCVTVDSSATAGYPSVLAVMSVGGAFSAPLELVIHEGARVEGVAALVRTDAGTAAGDLASISPTAVIVGLALSDSRMTLDGTVTGSVVTEDFYFSLPPTMYIGWLRSAHIDRSGLPPGFLVPLAIGGVPHLQVLVWL